MDRVTYRLAEQITTPGIPAKKGFNAILFVNKGADLATIQGFPLPPGDRYGWSLNSNEVDMGEYLIDFPNGYTNANVWITYIFYQGR